MTFRILPWLWIALGVGFCFVMGSFIKTLAHANGPDTGGALILLPFTVAAYPVGLIWIGVGLLLLFSHRWAAALAVFSSVTLLLICSLALYLPPLLVPVGVIAAIPIFTLVTLSSRSTRNYRAARTELQEWRLERIRNGHEIPAVVPILSYCWIAAGFVFTFSFPLSWLLFRIFPALSQDAHQREFVYLVAFCSVPFGLTMIGMGRQFRKPGIRTVTYARVLLVLGWLGFVFDAMAVPSVAILSTWAFFYVASWVALGQPAFKAYGESFATSS